MLGNVDVFVDGRGDEEAAVFAVVGREVGAAAAEGDAQRGTGDDHRKGRVKVKGKEKVKVKVYTLNLPVPISFLISIIY